MLAILTVRRSLDNLTIYVDNEGMHIKVTRTFLGEGLQFCQWHVQEYPEAFIASAKQSLKGYQGFQTCFIFPVSESFIDGRFGAHSNDEWIDFFFTMDSKSVDMLLRKTEVEKLVRVVSQYWNQ